MSLARLHFHGVIIALAMITLLVANDSVSAEPGDQAPGIVPDGDPNRSEEIPIHFILNPDVSRPPGYPTEIPLEKLQVFLKTQRMTGQGCGGTKWEGTACGMFSNTYAAAKTPWLTDEVDFDASYAQTKTGTFLASFMLGRNRYGRADRNSDKLIWEQNYEPEYERNAIRRVLFGDDSAQRKTLLTKISGSLKGLDLTRFPAKSRELLALQLQPCENDPDPAVVALAKELRKALTMSDSRP